MWKCIIKHSRRLGKVLRKDDCLTVRYYINPSRAKQGFRKWVIDTIFLILPLLFFFMWLFIESFVVSKIEGGLLFAIFSLFIGIASVHLCGKNKKAFDQFIEEWNSKEEHL